MHILFINIKNVASILCKDLKISVVYKDCLPCLKYEDLIDVLRHNVHHLKIEVSLNIKYPSLNSLC